MITFSTPPTLVGGEKYWIVATSTDSSGNGYYWFSDDGNPYGGGGTSTNTGTGWSAESTTTDLVFILHYQPNVTLTGSQLGDQFGYSVSGAGDLNKDGYNDTIIGAPYNESAKGAVYVFNGSANIPSTISALDANYTAYGENANDRFGFSVSAASDINGDTYPDAIVGAPGYSSNKGRAYVYTTQPIGVVDQKPSSQASVPGDYWKISTPFNISWNASDDNGLTNITLWYRYSMDNSSWSGWISYAKKDVSGTYADNSTNGNFSFTASNGDGYYQFYTIANDTKPQSEDPPATYDACAGVDTTKPSSAVLPISPYWQTSATFTITANASDYNATGGESGVKNITLYYRYSTDNSSWGSWTYSSTNSTLTFTDPYNCTASFTFNSPDGDGYYEFYSIAADNATNEELAPTEKDALAGVDTTPPGNWNNPEIKGNSSATWVSKESWVNETTVDCKLGAGDTLSGVNLSSIEYGYSTNDGDTWTWASAGWSGSETSGVMYAWGVAFGMESSQSSGYPLRIRFRLKDKAGNVNDYNVWQVKIDITAPSKPLDITAKPSYWTNVNNFNISWTNPADVSGIVGAYYKIGSAPTNNTDGTYVSGANISWIDGIIVPDNGTWTIYVWLRDAANNVNYANNNSTTVYYDAIPPNNPTSCTTPGVQNNTWQNSTNDTNFTWSGASDPPAPDGTFSGVSGYYYYWGKDAEGIGADANYTTIPAFDPAPIPNEGVYYLRVKTRDNASNNASWITLFVFKYDNSTPGYWQNFYPPTGWVNTTTVNCSIQVRDFYKSIGNASGLNVSSAYFNYSTDGGTVWSGWLKANCTGSNGTNDFQTVWAWVTFVDGINKNKIKFKISDMIGQMNISEIYSVDVDTTPPTSFVDSISPYWHNTTLTITATANDTLSGVKNITLYYYNSTNNDTFDGPWLFSTNETPTKVGNNWTASWEFNFSLAKGEGYYRFYSLAIDNASNQESLELYAKNNTFSGTVENSTNIQGTPDDKYASLSSETSWIRGGNYSVATGTIVKVEIAWRYYVLPEFTNDKINLRYLVNGVYGATALGAFTPTSTTPVINYVDVTADRTWTWSDIALLEVHADYTVTGGVDGTLNIDALWIRVTAIDTICGYDSTPPSNPMPPATESNGAQNNTWQNTVKSPAFEWPWPSDNLAGVDGFYWYFGPSDTGTSTSYVTTNSTSVGTWENGTYYFRIMTRDKAGNNNTSWITMFVFKHDAALPTITYNYPSAGGATSWYNGDPGNVIDIDFGWVANSPLDYAQYRIGAGSWIDIFTADQASDYTANWNVAWASLTDGNNEISIRVADIAGNILTHTYVSGASGFLFRKDTVAPANPTNNNTNPEINIWTNDNTIYVEWWGASDDHSGIAGYYYAWTQDSTTIPTASDNYTTTTSNLSSPLADGIWYLHIRAVDNASNLASGAYHVGAFKIDTTPPSSTIETPLNDATIDTTPIWINGTCSDQAQLSGINKVEINITYKENGTVVKAWINTNLAANYSWWDYQFYPPSEGNYTIKVRAVDNASNVGAVVQINITYSKAAPTITKVIFYITENNDTYTKYPNLTLNLSIEVSGATSVKVRFRNEYYEWHAWLDYNLSSETYLSGKYNHYSWVLSKNDGTKIVYVEINASSVKGYTLANSNDDIILDSLKPSISNLIPLDGSLVRNRTVNITAIVNDTHIDWSSMTVRIDGNATNRWQNTNKTPVLEGWKIWVVWNFSTDGDYHRVEIVVKDYANNTAVKEWSFVVDSTPVTPGDIRFSHYHAREGQNITIYVTIYKNETTPGEVEFTVIIRNHAGDSLAIYNATTGELIPNGKFIIGKGTFITVKAYDIIVEKGDKTTDVTGRKYLAATYTVIVNNSTASPEKEIERQTAIFPIVYLEPPPAPVPSFEITFVAVLGASLLIALISTLRKRKK
ncbi:MAG: integrin alpha [Candidatus Thermoplasmatota archaeon]